MAKKLKAKRITAKQKSARRRNIKIAQQTKKKGGGKKRSAETKSARSAAIDRISKMNKPASKMSPKERMQHRSALRLLIRS